jgi:hypothetical protein
LLGFFINFGLAAIFCIGRIVLFGIQRKIEKEGVELEKRAGVFEARGNFYNEIDGAQTLTGAVLCL